MIFLIDPYYYGMESVINPFFTRLFGLAFILLLAYLVGRNGVPYDEGPQKYEHTIQDALNDLDF